MLAKRVVRSKQISEQCERTSERTSEWPSTLLVVFMQFLPKVQWWRTGGGSGDANGDGAVHGGMNLCDINAFIS